MATQLALARDNLKWFAGFYTVTALGLFRSFHTSKNPALIAPLIPLTFALVFQADVAAGRKMERVRREADKILEKEGALFVPPVHNRLMPIEEYKKLFGIKE